MHLERAIPSPLLPVTRKNIVVMLLSITVANNVLFEDAGEAGR